MVRPEASYETKRDGLSLQSAADAAARGASNASLSLGGPSANDMSSARPKQVAVNAKHYAVLVTDVKQVCSYGSVLKAD